MLDPTSSGVCFACSSEGPFGLNASTVHRLGRPAYFMTHIGLQAYILHDTHRLAGLHAS